MKTFYRFFSILTLAALASTSARVALAQDQDSDGDRQYDARYDDPASDQNDQNSTQNYDQNSGQNNDQNYDRPAGRDVDPPARAARLQYQSGSVSIQPHGTDEWVEGVLNRPLTDSDNIWADKDSRAEINVGTGLIRIGAESSLTLTNISENMTQLQLHQGALNLHVRRLYDGETYEVDTPNQAFTVLKPGDYRFDVDPNADTTVITVWRGEGESTGDGPATRLRENVQARFSNGTSLQHDIHSAPRPDGFDDWARLRDNRLDHSASSRYVSPDVVGYEDLDEYGSWRDTPSYGHVWVPSRVDVGWAPYRNGHWIWVDPWGWTWVEDEPWGYAPFHYGRWVYNDNYWGWAPGPIYARPYYSPALVAWFGGGWGGVGVGFGYGGGYGYGGGVGWCALGYGEPYIPWYGVSRGYFNRVNVTNTRITNITNITNIYNNTYINNHPGRPGNPGGGPYGGHGGNRGGEQIRYANMRVPNGFTAVNRTALVNSQNVSRNAIRVSPNQLSRVTPLHNIDARPTRATMLGANAGRSAAAPPQRAFSRPIVSRATAPVGGRGAFHQESPVAGIGRNPGGFNRANAGRGADSSRGQANNGAVRPQMGNGQNGNGQFGRGMDRSAQDRGGQTGPRATGNANSNVRLAERGPIASRSVPRPGGFDNRGINPNQGGARSLSSNGSGMNNRGMNGGGMNSRDNSRPGATMSRPDMGSRGGNPDMRSSSVPRPSAGNMSRGGMDRPSMDRPSMNAPRSAEPQRGNAPSSNARPGAPRSDMSVPRPTGNAAPRGYSSAADRGSFPGSNGPRPSYNDGGSYGRPAPSNDRGSYSRPAPSYGGGAYSRPAPAPSYGGGGRSMPSYGGGGGRPSAPAYGGGGGGRMPSYGGGGGGGGRAPSYSGGGGGGRASGGGFGGGGGHASAPSGGGGGGARNNGGGHNGRH